MFILDISSRADFREWLKDNHNTATECYVKVKRGRPVNVEDSAGNNIIWYIDAVEEALCFGWIDSTVRNGLQRFTPRRKKTNWTELNKARCKRLITLGLMTDAGMNKYLKATDFRMDSDIENSLKETGAWANFMKFPELYRKIRVSNISRYKEKDFNTYNKMLDHLVNETIKGKMFGTWDDYGRLPWD